MSTHHLEDGARRRPEEHRILIASLRAHSDPITISLASKYLLDPSVTDTSVRAQILILRSLARSRMGLMGLAKVDALCARAEKHRDVQVLLEVSSTLRILGLRAQARQAIADARSVLDQMQTPSARLHLLRRDIEEAEATLAPFAAERLSDAILVKIFAFIKDTPSRARCGLVCTAWRNVLLHNPQLWDDVRLWRPFRLPTLSYYIDDAESRFPPPQRSFAQTNGALLHCAHASGNRLRHVSLDLRGQHEPDPAPKQNQDESGGNTAGPAAAQHEGDWKDDEEEVLVRTWATLRRSAPTLRTLSLCFTHRDTGARTHLSPLLRACIRLEQLTLYYVPCPRMEIEQSYEPVIVDLRLDDSNLPSSSLRAAHLYLPECAIIFDRLLIQRFAHLQELTLVRGVFEPLELSWVCALLRRVGPTLRTLQLGCAIDRSGSPTFNRLAMFQIELPSLVEYRSDTTEFDPEVRRLQATVRVPALRVLDLCNLDPEAILLPGEAEELPSLVPDQPLEQSVADGPSTSSQAPEVRTLAGDSASASSPQTIVWPATSLDDQTSSAAAPAAETAADAASGPSAAPSPPPVSDPGSGSSRASRAEPTSAPTRRRKRRVPSSTPSPPRLPLGILSVGDQLENLETLTLRTVSIQEEAAVLNFLLGLTARSLTAFSRSRERSDTQNAKPFSQLGLRHRSQLDRQHDEQQQQQAETDRQQEQHGNEVPMLLPRLWSLTIQDHVTLSADIIIGLVEARHKYVSEEEAYVAALSRSAATSSDGDTSFSEEPQHHMPMNSDVDLRGPDTELPVISGLVRVSLAEDYHPSLMAAAAPEAAPRPDGDTRPTSGPEADGDGPAGNGGSPGDARSVDTVKDQNVQNVRQQRDDVDGRIYMQTGPHVAPYAGLFYTAARQQQQQQQQQHDDGGSPAAQNSLLATPLLPTLPPGGGGGGGAMYGPETESNLPTDSGATSNPTTAAHRAAARAAKANEDAIAGLDPALLARLSLGRTGVDVEVGGDALRPAAAGQAGTATAAAAAAPASHPGTQSGPAPDGTTTAPHSSAPSSAAAPPVLPALTAPVYFRPLEVVRLLHCARIVEAELDAVRYQLGLLEVR